MDFSKSNGPDLLPPGHPSPHLLVHLNDRELSDLSETALRIALWTAAVARLFEVQAPWKTVLGYRFAAFGFADPDFEADAFGALIYARPGAYLGNEKLSLEGDGFVFPVFVRRVVERYHAPTIHPTNGTATCWAKSGRLPSTQNSGLLTAKHLLSDPRIGSLTSTTAGYGKVLDIAPDGIDAALLEAPHCPAPPTRLPLRVARNVVPWTDVQLDGAQSGSIPTKITAVTDTRGSLSPVLPARVFLAAHGLPGDSGALVKDTIGVGVGIYVAEMVDMAGRTEGVCQHLAQAKETMDLILYE
jgi:hypothetical protein